MVSSTMPSVQGEHGPPAAADRSGEARPPLNAAALQRSGPWTDRGAGPDGWEGMFDELAERLEEAAAQMGIDLEG